METGSYMNGKALSPSHLSGRTVAAEAGVCLAARLGQGVVASRFHGMRGVAGKSTGIGGQLIGLDRLGKGKKESWYRKEKSAQAGGNDAGP
jgi:hypothetical protein